MQGGAAQELNNVKWEHEQMNTDDVGGFATACSVFASFDLERPRRYRRECDDSRRGGRSVGPSFALALPDGNALASACGITNLDVGGGGRATACALL